jgi:phospholipid transport system substrate-binding protein
MMQSRTRGISCGMIVALCLALLLPGAGLATADEPGPVELLEDRQKTVLAIVEQDPAVLEDTKRLREIAYEYLLPHVDFMTLSRWVMGKHWRKATPEQRQTFANEFRDLLLNNYLRSVTEYRDQSIEFLPLRNLDGKNKVVVHGLVDQPGGPPVHVNFRMHRNTDSWLIYDIVVEGVSLATTHRSMFSQQIRDIGIEGVIAELESRNAAAWKEGTSPAP